jgi:hypothetical protein
LVRNYANSPRTYAIGTSFRYANDQASAAVQISTPPSVSVPANGTATFLMSLKVTPSLLPNWNLNGGSSGGNGGLLNLPEYDGYLTLSQGGETVHLPWHILPHKATNFVPSTTALALNGTGSGNLTVSNAGGAAAGILDAFVLDGTSEKLPAESQPRPGENFAIIDLKSVGTRLVDVGGGTLAVQFAIDTWGQRSHPNYPAEFNVYVDSNNDGDYDYVLYTVENGGFAASGQNVVVVVNLATNASIIRFFANADLSSSTMVMTALLSDLGLAAGTKFNYQVLAFDNYFTGALTDLSDPATLTLGTRRFAANPGGVAVPAGGSEPVTVTYNPAGDAASPTDKGILLLNGNGRTGAESSAITVTP